MTTMHLIIETENKVLPKGQYRIVESVKPRGANWELYMVEVAPGKRALICQIVVSGRGYRPDFVIEAVALKPGEYCPAYLDDAEKLEWRSLRTGMVIDDFHRGSCVSEYDLKYYYAVANKGNIPLTKKQEDERARTNALKDGGLRSIEGFCHDDEVIRIRARRFLKIYETPDAPEPSTRAHNRRAESSKA